MRYFPFVLVLMASLLWSASAEAGNEGTTSTFSAYLKQLSEGGSLVFSSSCVMMNGDRGEMLFQQSGQGGTYFEINGDKTVRSEQVINQDGGYFIKTESGTRFIGKGDEPIKTLIMSPYFVLTPYQLDTILQVPPKHKCFEQHQ